MIEKMPKISIIVPVYNVEYYIEKCIKSILNQVFTEFELILVDDGSTDNSGNICDKYAEKDNRIIVIHKENGGISSARNIGLDIAKGEYIGFVDSDDFIHPMMYEILYTEIKNNKDSVVICQESRVYTDDIKYECINEYNLKKYNNKEIIELVYKKGDTFVYAWNKLYEKSIFEHLRYKEGVLYEDEDLTPKILYYAKNIIFIDKELYFYRQRNNSIVNSKFSSKKFDRVYAIENNTKFFKDLKEKRLFDISEKSYLELLIWTHLSAINQLKMDSKSLKELKSTMNHHVISMLNNDLISYKQKIANLIYWINDKFYFKFIVNK